MSTYSGYDDFKFFTHLRNRKKSMVNKQKPCHVRKKFLMESLLNGHNYFLQNRISGKPALHHPLRQYDHFLVHISERVGAINSISCKHICVLKRRQSNVSPIFIKMLGFPQHSNSPYDIPFCNS